MKWLTPLLARAHAISAFLDVIAGSEDLGVVLAEDPRLSPNPHCDVCNDQPRAGHLLEGPHGFAGRIEPNNPVTPLSFSICSLGPDEQEDARYWVCSRCYALLHEDRVALVRETLEQP